MSIEKITRKQYFDALDKVLGLDSENEYDGELDLLLSNDFVFLEGTEPWQNINCEDQGVVVSDNKKYFAFTFSDNDEYYFCLAESNDEDFYPVMKVGIRRGNTVFEIGRQPNFA